MKIINVGSINIDHVYSVAHFVSPGETLESRGYAVYSGGKGANQSVALARAGAEVMHVGKIGADGLWVKEKLARSGVDTSLVVTVADHPTGHAVIQVDEAGENAIIIHGGANRTFTPGDFDAILKCCSEGDYLLLQNEINDVDLLIEKGSQKGIKIVFNPAPFSEAVSGYALDAVDIIILNETEGEGISGERGAEAIASRLAERFPACLVVLTLGSRGVLCREGEKRFKIAAPKVKAVDTTGAGDTFIGYFVAALSQGEGAEKAVEYAIKAAAVCVTRPGAADSIPYREELL